jgi:hypothetical protein
MKMKYTEYIVIFTIGPDQFVYTSGPKSAAILAAANRIRAGMDYEIVSVINNETKEEHDIKL